MDEPATTPVAAGEESKRAQPRSRGRPRSVEAEKAILKVAGELLSEGGFIALNYDELASRARCSKATIYRRWASKGHLAVAALAELPDPPPTPDRGDLRVELRELLGGIVAIFATTPAIKIMQSLVGERARNPELADLLDQSFYARRRGLAEVLERGLARGELRPGTDIELVMDLIVGPILYRHFCTAATVDPGYLDAVVESALSAHS
ncbi:MAG: TetR/AcrR family transcriptional regulator [Deltaproteobacteria bacterium]|jgi:AcrR family transcriptional regulator|nr:TetR/AcrR family transcriptional regulator [Deltaproteobacteria bacterium]MBW2499464.1 TetR/AcrR family transcriptional regulator [Deltaproteobacteria bacterium]